MPEDEQPPNIAADMQSNNHLTINPELPVFSDDNPHNWFSLVDMAFTVHRITDDNAKAYCIMRALPGKLQNIVSDKLIFGESMTSNNIKNVVLEATTIPQQKRIEKLLKDATMDDRTPSGFLKYLRKLAGEAIDENSPVIRSILLQNIPKRVLMIVAPEEDTPLDDIVRTADRIYKYTPECSRSSNNDPVFSLTQQPVTSTDLSINNASHAQMSATLHHDRKLSKMEDMIKSLSEQVSELTQALTRLTKQQQYNQRRSRSHSRDRDKSHSNSSQASSQAQQGYCYYHRRFGSNSTRCTTPCTWTTDGQQKN